LRRGLVEVKITKKRKKEETIVTDYRRMTMMTMLPKRAARKGSKKGKGGMPSHG